MLEKIINALVLYFIISYEGLLSDQILCREILFFSLIDPHPVVNPNQHKLNLLS